VNEQRLQEQRRRKEQRARGIDIFSSGIYLSPGEEIEINLIRGSCAAEINFRKSQSGVTELTGRGEREIKKERKLSRYLALVYRALTLAATMANKIACRDFLPLIRKYHQFRHPFATIISISDTASNLMIFNLTALSALTLSINLRINL